MNKLILTICFSLFFGSQAFAQILRFSKYQINETGYFCYFPGDPGKFEVQTSEDGQLIYQAETVINECKYGMILVIFQNQFAGTSNEGIQDLLISYMDYLKTSFEIKSSAGYGKGHTMDSHPEAQGVIDYWENAVGVEFAIKGWIDKNALGFLYISAKELPDINYQNMFLNGFRFKE